MIETTLKFKLFVFQVHTFQQFKHFGVVIAEVEIVKQIWDRKRHLMFIQQQKELWRRVTTHFGASQLNQKFPIYLNSANKIIDKAVDKFAYKNNI